MIFYVVVSLGCFGVLTFPRRTAAYEVVVSACDAAFTFVWRWDL
jgi:hypothetical protein